MSETARAAEATYTRRVLVTLGLVLLALFLWKIAPVLLLAFAGIVFASGLRAAAAPLSRRTGMSDVWAVGIAAASIVLLFAVGAFFFGQQIAKQAQDLLDALREAWGKFSDYVARFPIGQTAMETLKTGADGEALAKVAKGTFTVFGALADLALVAFLSIYLAADPRLYRNGLLKLAPPAARKRLAGALDASGEALRKWFVGQLVSMACVGVLTTIGLWILGVPMAIPLGILTMVLDFVPFVGPLIAAAFAILIAFAQSPQLALYAGGVFLAMQFIEGHFIVPLAQRWAVEVPPALSLMGIVAFGILFGPLGVLLAMPLVVVSMVMVQRLYVEPLER